MSNYFLAIQPKAAKELQSLNDNQKSKFMRLAKRLCDGSPVNAHKLQNAPDTYILKYGSNLRVSVKKTGYKISVQSISIRN